VTRYFDATALAKRYVRETGSSTVRRLLATGSAATSRLSDVEVTSAIVRRAREGAFTTDERDLMLAAFQQDVPALAMVELTSEIAAEARTLLLRVPDTRQRLETDSRRGSSVDLGHASLGRLKRGETRRGQRDHPRRSPRRADPGRFPPAA
jgi:predicted nucleic acid-binding protein